MNNKNIGLLIMALVIIWAFAYMAYGEDALPTPKDIALQQRARLLEEQSQIDRDNLKILAYCNEYASGAKADERQKAQYDCYRTQRIPDLDIPDLSTWTASSGAISTVPPKREERMELVGDRSLSLECELWVRERKVEGIEFHYTDTVGSTLQSIKKGHENKFGIDHIGYHFVIKENGEITNTRDERCIAAADKWSGNNYRLIQIAFVWKDKPTKEQVSSMVELTRKLISKYNLPIDSVSSHRDWGPKSDKESMTYWFGWVKNFLSLVEWKTVSEKPTNDTDKVLLRNWEVLDSVNYAWNKWKDMDFILTIDQESRWNPDAVGDVDHPNKWDYAYGYCQYNSAWHKDKIAYYKSLPSWKEKIDWCHERYIEAMDRAGGIGGTFHGYNSRLKNKSKYTFK